MSLANIKEPNPQKTHSGEEHGLIKVLANSVPPNSYQRFKEKDRGSMEKLHKEQSRLVKVQYIHKKGKAERREMSYCLWDGDPILSYRFIPDHEYEVPKGLIDMVNGNKRQKRSDLLDPYTNKPLLRDELESGDDMFVGVIA